MRVRSISRRGRTCFCTPFSRVRSDRVSHPILLEPKEVDPLTQLVPDSELVDKLVVANRILYRQGVVDGFGHLSARHDKSPGHFLLARTMAPGLVRREDIITFDLDGTALDAEGRRVYLERFIHGEIYRARSDVRAIVHSHSPSVIPFGVTGQPLRPIFHMSGFLAEGAALFEIREIAGDTDMLISDRRLGKALAAALGARSTGLVRGDGAGGGGGEVGRGT